MGIQRYIEGFRGGQDINSLERLALQDKFMAETLDGYDKVKGNHAQNVADLQQTILKKKTAKKTAKKPTKNYRKYFTTAAVILVIIAVAGFIIYDFDEIFPPKNITPESTIPAISEEYILPIIDSLNIDTIQAEVTDNIIPLKIPETPIFEEKKVEKEKKQPIVANNDTPKVEVYDFNNVKESPIKEEKQVAAEPVNQPAVQPNVTAATSEQTAEKTKTPQPIIGKKAYKNYLKTNLVRTNDTQGKVIVTFSVDASYRPTNIRITKSLSPACDKEAIRLIKSGCNWTASDKEAVVEVSF
jgi:protein TonB